MLSRSEDGLLNPTVHEEKILKGKTSSQNLRLIIYVLLGWTLLKKKKKNSDRLDDESVKGAKRKNNLDNEPKKKEDSVRNEK